jgi:hypothetical protein
MRCVACGERAPTRDVIFYSNIGLLAMRLTWTHEGQTCSPCIHSTYWRYTLTTLAVGWLGIVSLIMTPFIIIGNTFVYCTTWFTVPTEPEPEDY